MSAIFRIGILDDYQGVALGMADWKNLDRSAVTTFRHHIADRDRLVAELQPFDAVVLMRERTALPATVLERLPNLRLIVTTGMKNASIDVAAARKRGVVVCGTRARSEPAAELAWSLILALFRNVVAEDANLRAGRWQQTVGRSVSGARIGIVGLGRIGAIIARYANAFGMETIAWSENLTSERATQAGARAVTKDELFQTADVVTLHLRASPRTRHIVGPREIGLMKPTAFLVNTARAELVDESALFSALSKRRIAGAGLDVFSEEPIPPDHPFLSLPNAVLTPHVGYVTEQNYALFFGDAVENVRAFLQGTPLREVAGA